MAVVHVEILVALMVNLRMFPVSLLMRFSMGDLEIPEG